jgi:hypothetical protein
MVIVFSRACGRRGLLLGRTHSSGAIVGTRVRERLLLHVDARGITPFGPVLWERGALTYP